MVLGMIMKGVNKLMGGGKKKSGGGGVGKTRQYRKKVQRFKTRNKGYAYPLKRTKRK